MTREEKIERKRWVEGLTQNPFVREWLGEYDEKTQTFSGGMVLANLKEHASSAPLTEEGDKTAMVARRMIGVHNSYMTLLSQYVREGRIEEATLAAELAEQARAA